MSNWSLYFEENQHLWDKRTNVHKDSEFYDVEGFLAGKEILNSIELSEVGPIQGKTLLHLQCHFGLDTLAWARHGAIVTGVDFSPAAVSFAKDLAEKTSLTAEFICCNLYDVTSFLDQNKFDIIYTSYGVINWLPDLDKWAAIIRNHLNVNGFFYMAEFHPVLWMFDDNFSQFQYSYFNRKVISNDSNGTYTDQDSKIVGKEHTWNHGISEVLNALTRQGMVIRFFNEFDYSPYPCFKNTVAVDKGKWQIQGYEGKLPMVYSLIASIK